MGNWTRDGGSLGALASSIWRDGVLFPMTVLARICWKRALSSITMCTYAALFRGWMRGAPVAIIAGAVAGDIVVAYIVYRRTRTAGLDPVRHEAVVVAPTVRLRLGRG